MPVRLLVVKVTVLLVHVSGSSYYTCSFEYTHILNMYPMTLILSLAQILCYLQLNHSYSESGSVFSALKNGSLAAAIHGMADHQLSSSIVLALLDLCGTKNSYGVCVCV